MLGDEDRILLGFLPNSTPTMSQLKLLTRSRFWNCIPTYYQVHGKRRAEFQFKRVQRCILTYYLVNFRSLCTNMLCTY
ncbi:hypothetical protein LINGRAHAP2_LOCUS4494 [Linum grandiflorum]